MDTSLNQGFGPFELPAVQPRRIPHSLASEIEAAVLAREKAKLRREVAPDLPLSIDIDAYLSFRTHLASCTRIVALLGAGLSASSGIGTFRDAGGIWRGMEVRSLAKSTVFEENPSLIWWLYADRRREALKAVPNRGHLALAALAQKMGDDGMLTVCQNIDDLCPRAGQPDDSTIYLHGSIFEVQCTSDDCEETAYNNADPIVPALALSSDAIRDIHQPLPEVPRDALPRCQECSSLLRPAVTWFGEPLPPGSIRQIQQWLGSSRRPQKVDLVFVIGTSATVHPAAAIVNEARERGARVCVINPDAHAVEMIGGLDDGDWWFKGGAEVVLPEILKDIVGEINEFQETTPLPS